MPEARQSPQAREDLLRIWLQIAQDNPEAARIDETAKQLPQFPEIGRLRKELAPGIRSIAVGNYIVFYQAVADGIEIVRVLHGARDLPPLFE